MANSADPDQLASSEANLSGSTLFAKAGYIRAQQDKVIDSTGKYPSNFLCITLIDELLYLAIFDISTLGKQVISGIH